MLSFNIKKSFLKTKENCIKGYKKTREYFCQFKYLKKAFIIISLIYLLAFCTIFRANFNYKDDIGRTLLGYQGWDNFSRYTTQNLSTIIHTDTILRDISPLFHKL